MEKLGERWINQAKVKREKKEKFFPPFSLEEHVKNRLFFFQPLEKCERLRKFMVIR